MPAVEAGEKEVEDAEAAGARGTDATTDGVGAIVASTGRGAGTGVSSAPRAKPAPGRWRDEEGL